MRLRTRAAGVLVGGALLTALVVVALATTTAQRERQSFEAAARAAEDAIADRVETCIALLRGAAGLFASQQNQVTVGSFRAYMNRVALREHYPGILGIGFSRRIGRGERAALEQRMREQGHPQFRVWPADERAEWHSIVFLEPLDQRNRAAIGYDMYTEAVRRAAMARARDLGRAAASGLVELVQEIDERKQPGFLIYLPVYEGGATPASVDERRERLLGFAYAPIRAADFLSAAFTHEIAPHVSFSVYHGSGVLPAAHLYSRGSPQERARFTLRSTLEVAGETWTLEFRSLARAGDGLLLPLLAAAAGLTLTILLAALLWREAHARLQSESANRAKDEFLAMLGHELRNPLAAIANSAYVLRAAPPGSDSATLSRGVIERQVAVMKRLIDDLLDISRLTMGKIQVRPRRLDLAALAAETVSVWERTAGEPGRVQRDLAPAWVDADPARVEQMITNLLDNAVKFSAPRTPIRLRVAREGDAVLLEVIDEGEGFPAEMLPRLFEPFVQGEQDPDRPRGGMGVGLALVRRLAQLHGGSAAASSAGRGRGATFHVRLPAAAEPAAAEVPSAARPGPQPRRVLVVEDHADARATMEALLRLIGHSVRAAPDGAAGLACAQGWKPDVALLDIGLPGLDGYELARRLRKDPSTASITLIALTGYGQAHDVQRAREAGFDAHLSKPVTLERLEEILASPCEMDAAYGSGSGASR